MSRLRAGLSHNGQPVDLTEREEREASLTNGPLETCGQEHPGPSLRSKEGDTKSGLDNHYLHLRGELRDDS